MPRTGSFRGSRHRAVGRRPGQLSLAGPHHLVLHRPRQCRRKEAGHPPALRISRGQTGCGSRPARPSRASHDRRQGTGRAAVASSLVVNATGLGKDTPGSALTGAAVMPRRCVAWDMNYRGPLTFLQQARAQQDAPGLRIADGWRFFLHGWTNALAPILDVPPGNPVLASVLDTQRTSQPGREGETKVIYPERVRCVPPRDRLFAPLPQAPIGSKSGQNRRRASQGRAPGGPAQPFPGCSTRSSAHTTLPARSGTCSQPTHRWPPASSRGAGSAAPRRESIA